MRTLIQLIHTFLPEWYFNIFNKIINSIWHRKCFFLLLVRMGNIIQHCPTAARNPACAWVPHDTSTTHTHKFSVSWSWAFRFVLQVPWHKPSSQEANHTKSVSHVAAYTGSEALRGVIFDIVLQPHTVTHIPQPQLCFWEVLTPNLSTRL